MKLQELFTSEDKWTKHAEARNEHGCALAYDDPNACRWCLSGAIWYCYLTQWERAIVHNKIYIYTVNNYPRCTVFNIKEPTEEILPILWNDSEERTFSDVRELIEFLNI